MKIKELFQNFKKSPKTTAMGVKTSVITTTLITITAAIVGVKYPAVGNLIKENGVEFVSSLMFIATTIITAFGIQKDKK